MTIVRWNPMPDVTAWHPVTDLVSEFAVMQHEIDRMFDRFRGGMLDENSPSLWMPAVDIIERENDYYIKAELPGVNKNDVRITVQNDVLTIRGEKKNETEKKSDNYRRVERSYGSFERSFTLPTSVKNDKIEASYDNGVLTISLPKAEESKPKEIEVKVK
ncbi:MAG: Hsp20/alpha crystallin family protein [Ignavibacteria bacterium]|nr:Hsp20/alpha crystallin family protein [Ignavibacteria bacterium]MBI3766453.1 Hsp20/alpha crystallin family protein [Ignavibacteriales bacterium]